MTNIVIWNALGIKGKREEIIKNIQDSNIFAVTESKIDNHYSINVSGYSSVRLDSVGNNSGGIIIFVNKKYDYKVINFISNFNSNSNCDVIGISIDSIDLDLIVIYRKPYGTAHKSLWSNICRLGSSRKNTIIAEDFNSHHPACTSNCTKIDKNGENLLQTMINFNFFLYK